MDQPKIDYGKIWEQIIIGDEKSFVCFSNGTCVIFNEPQDDIRKAAVALMTEWGPVSAGSSAGDFSVIHLENHPGWVITSHHNDILTYVDPSEGDFDPEKDVGIGLYGRSKRDADSEELIIINLRDNSW